MSCERSTRSGPRPGRPLPSTASGAETFGGRRDRLGLETIGTTAVLVRSVHMATAQAPARVLVVANKTAATPALLAAVRERAAAGPCTFTLLVPNAAHGLHRVVDPEDQDRSEAEATLELALPLLSEAAGRRVDGLIGDPEPLSAIQDAINLHGFDEI